MVKGYSKKASIAEKIQWNRKKRNASALTGSRFEFENNLDIIFEEIEQNNARYDLDIDPYEQLEYMIEQRQNFLEDNVEYEEEIFERELAGWGCNTPVSDTKKNWIKIDIDCISGTLKSAKNCGKFAEIFLENGEVEEGLFNYNYQKYLKKIYSNGLIFYMDRVDMNSGEIDDNIIYFNWNGEDCRELDCILWEYDTNWIEFLKELVVNGNFKITRIDGASTFVGNKMKLSTIKRKLERGEYKGHFKNKPTIVSSVGETYYLGYRQDCMIRFYDKKIETILKKKLRALEYLNDKYPEVTRIEIQMRNKYAQAFLDDLIKYQNEENVIQETIRSWICKKVTFLSDNGETNKSRMTIAPFWREFSETKLEVKATYERPNIKLEDSAAHIIKNNKSLTAMYFIKQYYITTKKEPKNPLFRTMIEKMFPFVDEEDFKDHEFKKYYLVSKEMYYRMIQYAQVEKDLQLLGLIKKVLRIQE